MREIKFRAWDGEQMQSVRSFNPDEGKIHIRSKEWLPIKSTPIMQYTGLKDKNGTEIYEGDIVTVAPAGYGRYKVGFELGAFGIFTSGGFEPHSYRVILSDCEVIGNIYENKELLK